MPAGAGRLAVTGRAVAVDVQYLPEGRARAAAVVGADRTFAEVVSDVVLEVSGVAPYVPGRFYERELPPLLEVLAEVGERVGSVPLVVVDGYVDLDPAGRPGLGAHLHDALGVPVVGVAKTRFRGAEHAVEVLRGGSARPLLVTAAGLGADEAAAAVAAMAGVHRVPDALRRVDALARGRA